MCIINKFCGELIVLLSVFLFLSEVFSTGLGIIYLASITSLVEANCRNIKKFYTIALITDIITLLYGAINTIFFSVEFKYKRIPIVSIIIGIWSIIIITNINTNKYMCTGVNNFNEKQLISIYAIYHIIIFIIDIILIMINYVINKCNIMSQDNYLLLENIELVNIS